MDQLKKTKKNVLRRFRNSEADIMCGHLECDGFEVTPGMKFDHGMDSKSLTLIVSNVYGLDISITSQSMVMFNTLATPIRCSGMIIKTARGFHIYDTESDRLKFVKNPFEIFDKIFYDDTSVDYNKQDVSCYKDKFIKLIVEEKRDYQMFETLVDRLYNVGVHDVKIVETFVDEDNVDDADLETKDTMTLVNEYIDEVEIAVDKTDLKSLMRTLYIESCQVV